MKLLFSFCTGFLLLADSHLQDKVSVPGPVWGTHMGKKGWCGVFGTPCAVQLHEVTALAAALSLERTSKNGTT